MKIIVPLSISSTQTTFADSKSDYLLPHPERRKSRRFPLRQSSTIRYKGAFSHELPAFTLNASVEGAYLTADTSVPEGWGVNVMILLQKDGLDSVRLHGTGKVVRSETSPTGRFGIAVIFDKPMTAG